MTSGEFRVNYLLSSICFRLAHIYRVPNLLICLFFLIKNTSKMYQYDSTAFWLQDSGKLHLLEPRFSLLSSDAWHLPSASCCDENACRNAWRSAGAPGAVFVQNSTIIQIIQIFWWILALCLHFGTRATRRPMRLPLCSSCSLRLQDQFLLKTARGCIWNPVEKNETWLFLQSSAALQSSTRGCWSCISPGPLYLAKTLPLLHHTEVCVWSNAERHR